MSQNGITEVGKYRIIEQIGEGAMGVVYRALDPVLNRTVAIKVMSDALARDDQLRSRFLREAQAAGSLQHPNVITIYDFGEIDGHLFIAMEFVEGKDLEEMIHANASLSVVDKIDILVDVLSGLGYAHKRGVVHRDVKPANIRLDEEGRARLMDFGIAHLQSSNLTRTGLMVGTPAYMAPEQITGGAMSPQTDIFSVGAVMYELFTGNKPFQGESLQSVFYKIVTQPPADLTSVVPNLPASLNAIVMRALAKDPEGRFAAASDMANELTQARADLDRGSAQSKGLSLQSSIASGLSTRSTRPMRVVQRPRSHLLVAGSASAVLLLASVGIAISLFSRNKNEASQTASTPTTTVAPPAPVVSPPAAVTPPPNAVAQVQPTGAAAPPTPSPQTATRQAPKTAPAGPSAQEIALVRSLQSSALEARRRATEAGATADQLRAGDDQSTAANTAALQGKASEAASRWNLASAAWAVAERDARAAAAAAAAAASARTRVETAKQETVATPPPVVASAPAPVQPPVTQPTAARPPAPSPSVEIGALVAAYERAIETRDVAEVRRAHPGMTAAQSKGWEDFFKSLRSITVKLTMEGLDVRGDAADARVTGAYDYLTTAGKTVRQPVTFQTAFRKEGGAWRLVTVR